MNHALVEGPAQPHRLRQGDAENHQGHADGRRGEAAPRAVGGGSRASLCRTHGNGAGQPRLRHCRRAAPRCSPGTGKTRSIFSSSATAERGLCGGFNSSIARLAREKVLALQAEGKTVKILCVGKKGYDQLRRQFEKQISRSIDLRARAPDRLRACRPHRQEGHRLVRTRANSMSRPCSIRGSAR